MKGKSIKKLICTVIATAIIASMAAGCGKKTEDSQKPSDTTTPGTSGTTTTEKKPEDFKGEITFWHFNKDEGPVMAEMFMKKYPNVKVNVQIISDQDQGYQNKLTAAINSGSGMPDVYCGESAFVKRFVNMEGGFLDLSQTPYNAEEIAKNMVPYTVDIGRDPEGKIRALTYQATPGAIGYKRELAKQYFGTDDPDKISEMMSTPEKMLEMARQLKEKSGGKVTFFAARQELERLYIGARATGWVKDGKLVIDPMMDEYVDAAKIYRDEKLEAGLEQWSQAWSASIAANDVFAYAIPTWGIPWIIGSNDEARKDKGEWALAKSPIPYFWGGTWLGVYSESKNKELAWEFVKFITSDKDAMKEWQSKIGDFMNHKDIIAEEAAGNNLNATLNQNVYKFFEPALEGINGNTFTEYDDRIQAAWDDNMASYLANKISKEEFYKNFKEKVKSDFPDLIVE
ncbi:ABC transporter substrate-binding protein [Clostridium thermarum]|uniref:ABC transporter substrate-binding protein n=1 Tax=Clostridium thermarum TaxID=1716543 RepID=UPI0013D69374|nr:extracellular solute-binding protein [Clostridium thermarum]